MLSAPWKYAVYKIADESLQDFIASYDRPPKNVFDIDGISPSVIKDGIVVQWLVLVKNPNKNSTQEI